MSAVRRNDRRATRNTLSSPYARTSKSAKPHPSKKSVWTFSGLINFLNPFGDHGEPEDSDILGSSDGEIEQGPPPSRFSPPPQQPLPPPPPPQQQLSPHLPRPSARNGPNVPGPSPDQTFLNASLHAPSGSSLAKNLEPVTRFLVEKAGQPLNEFEAAGIVDYIQKSVQGSPLVPDKPEPFRFSVSPSRSASPNQTQGASSTETPRKTLTRNPNGVYRWQGAGSSRPRNRYQSPGFAPRPQQHRIKLSPPKTPLATDTKRRRVGDEAESSTPQKPAIPSTSTIDFPSLVPDSPTPHLHRPSGTLLNGKTTVSSASTAQPVTPKAQPRLRTAGPAMKPTTPAIPSPLRQTWKESDSPPQAFPPSRPTRAADFMTELIKEVTPTKKPDVSNPYQTASPVKPPAPVRKPVAKRSKPNSKPVEKPKEQEPEISARAIIEATVPKGTKRSRPPSDIGRVEEIAELEHGTPAVNGSPHKISPTSEGMETVAFLEDEESPSKRRKTPPTRLSPRSHDQDIDEASPPKMIVRPAEVIEPAENNIHMNGKLAPLPPTLSPPSATKPLFGGLKTSAPKEPSKLRYSFQADKVEVKNVDGVPSPPLLSFFDLAPVSSPAPGLPKSTVPPTAAPKEKLPPSLEALAMSVDELPRYSFPDAATSSTPADSGSSAARRGVLSLAVTALPIYELSATVSVRAMDGFNWTAAGLKAPTTSAQTWTCSMCFLENSADAKEQCAICESPRQEQTSVSSPSRVPAAPTPGSTAPPTAPVKGFNWTAAGLKVPSSTSSAQTWTCSLCSLENPMDAKEKCTVCEAPRPELTSTFVSSPSPAPESTVPPAAPAKSFDWSAAGLAPPPVAESGTWTCSVCSLANPASATDKCTVCETPR